MEQLYEHSRCQRLVMTLTLLLCILATATADAQEAADSAPIAATSANITLDQAIEALLRNNLRLKVERLNPQIEADRMVMASSEFDPEMRLSGTYESINRPQNTREFVATGGTNEDLGFNVPRIFEENNWRYNAAVVQKWKLGTEVEFGTRLESLDNTLNRQLPPSLYNPEYFSFTGVTVSQPLLRDGGIKSNTAKIRIASMDREIAALGGVATLSSAVANTIKAYYDLVFAYNDMRAKQEAITVAQQLYSENKKRNTMGVMTAFEVTEAEVAVSVRTEEALVATAVYTERQNALRLLIEGAENDESPYFDLVPEALLVSEAVVPDRDALMRNAMMNRADYQVARKQIDREQIKVAYSKNQLWPQLNLQASYGLNGLDSGYQDSYGRAFEQQGEQWSVGIVFSHPIGNRKAKKALAIAQKEMEQALLNLKQAELTLKLEVDTALSRLTTNNQRVQTAQNSQRLAKAALENENRLLDAGRGTSYSTLRVQDQVNAAGTRLLEAKTDLQKSLVDVSLVGGTLLEQNNISFGESQSDENPPPVFDPPVTEISASAKVDDQRQLLDLEEAFTTAKEIEAKESAGDSDKESLIVRVELIEKSDIPEVASLKGERALSVFEYKVLEVQQGDYALPAISIGHFVVQDRRLTSLAHRKAGKRVTLEVVPLSDYPSLGDLEIVDTVDHSQSEQAVIYIPKI
ncbi:MAG: TolC family protein [Verrucomicrobiae bacterium]|nr:TolC family protein [Verrucomicrobiae bacterium]